MITKRRSALSLPVYPFLPSMRCDEGCGGCCGPTTSSKAEFEAIKRYAAEHQIVPQRLGLTCPFYQKGTCAIYPVRPMVCRLFGHSKKLHCDRGYNVNIPERQEEKILNRYMREHQPSYLLHSLVYADDELMKLVDTEELAATEQEMMKA